MRRIDPVYPDLLPLSHRLGSPPLAAGDGPAVLDPVEMRLVRSADTRRPGDRTVPRRPMRVLVDAATADRERPFLEALVRAGSGLLVTLDAPLAPAALPAPALGGQVVVLGAWVPAFWGGARPAQLGEFAEHGFPAGVLLGLGPAPNPLAQVRRAVAEAMEAGAAFIVAAPFALPAEDRHRAYDLHAGAAGDGELENLLFHTDLGRLAAELEREASRECRSLGLPETLPGPATSVTPQPTFAAGAQLLLWARRLDLLDGVSSTGWQLRRAAQALLASRREPAALVAEDNLRVIPGFTPWVEAFARAMWSGGGEPFDEVVARWAAP